MTGTGGMPTGYSTTTIYGGSDGDPMGVAGAMLDGMTTTTFNTIDTSVAPDSPVGEATGESGSGENSTEGDGRSEEVIDVNVEPLTEEQIEALLASVHQEAAEARDAYLALKAAMAGRVQGSKDAFNQRISASEDRLNAGLNAAAAATQAAFETWQAASTASLNAAQETFDTNEASRIASRLSADAATEADHTSAVDWAVSVYDTEIGSTQADYDTAEAAAQVAFESAVSAAQTAYDSTTASLWAAYQAITSTAEADYESSTTAAAVAYTAIETSAAVTLQTASSSIDATLESSLAAAQSARDAALSGTGSTGYDMSFASDPAYQAAAQALVAAAQSSIDAAISGLESAVIAANVARDTAIAAATTTRQDEIAAQLATHTDAVSTAIANRSAAVASADAALEATQSSLALAHDATLSSAGTDLQTALSTALNDYQIAIDDALGDYDTDVRAANSDYESWATTRFGSSSSPGGTYKTDSDALVDAARTAIDDAKGPYQTAITDAENAKAASVTSAINDYIDVMLPKSWENPEYTEIWRTATAQVDEAFRVFSNLGDSEMLRRRLIPIFMTFMDGWVSDEQTLVEEGLAAKETLINALVEAEMTEVQSKSSASLAYANAVSGAISALAAGIVSLDGGTAIAATSRSAGVDNATSGAEAEYVTAKAGAQKNYDDAVAAARKAFRDTATAAKQTRADGETAAIADRTIAIDAASETFTTAVDAADSAWVAANMSSVETYQTALQAATETCDSAITAAETSAWSSIEAAVSGYVSSANSLFTSALVAANPGVTGIGGIAGAMSAYNTSVAAALLAAGSSSIGAIHSYNDTVSDAAGTYTDALLDAQITLAGSYSSATSTYVTSEAGAWQQASDDAANAIEQRMLSANANEKSAVDRAASAEFDAIKAITQATKDRVDRLAQAAKDDAQAAVNNATAKFNSDVATSQTGLTESINGIASALGTELGLQSTNLTEAIAAYRALMSEFVSEAKDIRIAEVTASLTETKRLYMNGLLIGLAGPISSANDVNFFWSPIHSFDPEFGVGELDGMLSAPPEPEPELPEGEGPPTPPPPPRSSVGEAVEMGWEMYKGGWVGLGHGLQITTNTFTFGTIAPLNESTQQLVADNSHLGYHVAEGAAGASRDALIAAGTLGAATWAAGPVACGSRSARAQQIYNRAMQAYGSIQGCRASVDAAQKVKGGDYIGAALSAGNATLNFLGAAQAGKLAIRIPKCFTAGTQVVVMGDQPLVFAINGPAVMSDEDATAGVTGMVAAAVGAALLAAKTRAESGEERVAYNARTRGKKRDEDDDAHGPLEPALPPPERLEANVIVAPATVTSQRPRSRRLSKVLTTAMLLCFTVAGWCWSQPLFRPSRFAAASFTADTPVATSESQYTTKNIEEIEVDDLVLARDEHGREIGWRRVVEVYRRTSDHLRHVTFRDESGREQTLDTTDEHPFLIANPHSSTGDQFVNASHLRLEDKVQSPNGSQQTLIATTRTEHPAGTPVFNFQVEGFHTYFVAQHDDTSPLLVHNAIYPVGTPGTLIRGPDALAGPVSFGKNFSTKVRKHIDQVRNRGSAQDQIPSPGKGGMDRVEQIIRDRVAQGGGRGTRYADEAATAFEDGGVTYIFRPNGEFWTILGN